MGEWKRVVPQQELAERVISAVVCVGAPLAIVVVVLLAPSQVISWSVIVSALLVVGGFVVLAWRSARAGVHFGSRGVLLYYTTRRSEVIPWNEVARFEACTVRLANLPVDGAAVYLVGPLGDLRETPIKQSVGPVWDGMAYSSRADVMLSSKEFSAVADELNAAARTFSAGLSK
ncbi:hypothetical protein [Lentzea cavernae]|uniref:PH domain-containing protein n=1 Tax=Lentzea cavernae TaxID=2020703 RepID=A0ABQ3MF94_9PSEU|nr:hypothetical protein [Lentzea cavernae]GHH43631.1 hypothetical protein GCM10017774_41510 [Lentzea cavernae]